MREYYLIDYADFQDCSACEQYLPPSFKISSYNSLISSRPFWDLYRDLNSHFLCHLSVLETITIMRCC